jgi:hypothetical protein
MSSHSLHEIQVAPNEKVAGLSRLWWVGLLVIVVATVVNIVLALGATTLFAGLAAFSPLGTGTIGLFTFVGALGAVIVFALLGRFAQRPIHLFRIAAVIVLMLSLIPDILLLVQPVFPSTTLAGVAVLMLLHIVTAAICVSMLTTLGHARA